MLNIICVIEEKINYITVVDWLTVLTVYLTESIVTVCGSVGSLDYYHQSTSWLRSVAQNINRCGQTTVIRWVDSMPAQLPSRYWLCFPNTLSDWLTGVMDSVRLVLSMLLLHWSIVRFLLFEFNVILCKQTLVPPRFQLWSAAPNRTTSSYFDHTEKKTHAVWSSGQNGRVDRRQENSDCSSPEWVEKASWATLHLLDGHPEERPSSEQPYLGGCYRTGSE